MHRFSLRFCFFLALAIVPACGGDDRPSGFSGRTPPAGGGQAGAGGMTEGGAGGQVAPKAGMSGADAFDASSDAPEPDAGHECIVDPLVAPSSGACVRVGDPGYACNPVTGVACNTAASETCEYDGAGFSCQALPADAAQGCRTCDPVATSCDVGFTCRGTRYRCTRYCCDDRDCGSGAICVAQPPTTLGICQAISDQALADFGWNLPRPDGGGEAGTDADGGSDAGADAPPPSDCAGCTALDCPDQLQACQGDLACAACLGSVSPADTCPGLMPWQLLLACRCSNCGALCPGSCL
jgi:hypothetical protein